MGGWPLMLADRLHTPDADVAENSSGHTPQIHPDVCAKPPGTAKTGPCVSATSRKTSLTDSCGCWPAGQYGDQLHASRNPKYGDGGLKTWGDGARKVVVVLVGEEPPAQ
jgi:hypothetical protein